MLSTGREDCVEGTFSTFVKLCEDCQDQLDSEEMEPVLNQLIQVSNTLCTSIFGHLYNFRHFFATVAIIMLESEPTVSIVSISLFTLEVVL